MFDCVPPPPEARGCEPEHAWPGDGLRWVAEPRRSAPGLDSLLTWAFQQKASRIAFQTGHPVWVSIHGATIASRAGRSMSTNLARSSTISTAPTVWRGCRAATTSIRPMQSRSTARRGFASGSTRRPRALRGGTAETSPALTRRAVEKQGQPYSAAIENALHEGRISEQTAAYELRQIG